MRILGIDPGTYRMGYGLIQVGDVPLFLDCGVISARPSLPLHQRLYRLFQELQEVVRRHQPDEVAIEEPFVGTEQRQYVRSALALGQAQAVAFLSAAAFSLPVFRYSPAQVKQSVTDYGAAPKEQVQEMVRTLLELGSVPSPSDAADALAVALCRWRQREVQALLSGGTV